MAAAAVAVILAASVGPAFPAGAEDVPAAEAAARARAAAAGDDAALEDLRQVTAIDGRPVDLDPIASASGPELSARLTDLADALDRGGAASPSGDPAADRRVAAEVLDQDEYHEPDLPRPFRQPLRWLGDRMIGLWDGAVGVLSPVLGTRGAVYVLLAAIATGFVLLVARVVRRATRAGPPQRDARSALLVDPSQDPADLERRADAARAAGDHAGAVRLRYEAGLVRLVRDGRIRLRAETTPSDAARQVDLPSMDELTAAFEEIVYGDRPASEADDDAQRRGWREVHGARSRR